MMIKRTILFSGVLAAFILMAFSGNKLHVDTYKVDTKKSTLEWRAEKLTGAHNGTILLSGGEIGNNHGNFTGSFEIDMSTIANTDIADAAYREKLENKLKSADFFEVAKFPKATFIITSTTLLKEVKQGGFTHAIKGNLTIKDKTNEITFDAKIEMQDNRITCVGTAIVDRAKFNIKYGSKTFFESIGDKMIYDEFSLKFDVLAIKQ